MNKTPAEVLDFYDGEIVKMISEKYGYTQMAALRMFLNSETYKMLSNSELEMWDFGPQLFLICGKTSR